jgi:hypothetical protein
MCDQVDLLERLECFAMIKHIEKAYDILMIHVLQQSQLAESSFSMGGCLKWSIELFNCHFSVVFCVDCRAAGKELFFIQDLISRQVCDMNLLPY